MPEKARLLDWTDVLMPPSEGPRYGSHPAALCEEEPLDQEVRAGARLSLKYGEPSHIEVSIENRHRTAFAALAGDIARRFGPDGLPPGTVTIEATGTAGQSFGAFAVRGMLVVLEGDANDYVGKGLSGGVLAIRPPVRATYRARSNVIVGNTVLYGATSGRAFFAGAAGERFAVRNSGATAVVESVGDHGCEYMTGGTVVILGPTGRNFGAGMSGGVAYLLDARHDVHRPKDLIASSLTAADQDEVRALLAEHIALTRSVWGAELLGSWKASRERFVRVVPREYQHVLEARRQAAANEHG